ncbi:MAG: hypothetical protein ACRD18_00485, partial [Terriglobia bacterium]
MATTLIVAIVAPAMGVVDGPVTASEKSATAVPETAAVGAVPVAFDVTLIEPVLLAVEDEELVIVPVGEKVTEKEQPAFGASVATQLSVSA